MCYNIIYFKKMNDTLKKEGFEPVAVASSSDLSIKSTKSTKNMMNL